MPLIFYIIFNRLYINSKRIIQKAAISRHPAAMLWRLLIRSTNALPLKLAIVRIEKKGFVELQNPASLWLDILVPRLT